MAMFKGFKPQGLQKIANSMGYTGSLEGFDSYLQQNPDKQNMMNMYNQRAMQMAQGGAVRKMAVGGVNVDSMPFNPFQAGTQAVVYGRDGKQYGSGMIAEKEGVTDYSYTQPPNQRNQPNPNDIAKATLGGNMIPAGERDQTATLQSGTKQGLSLPQPTVQGGVKTIATAQPPKQAFQDVQRPVYDTNQFLADGTTPNPVTPASD